jgi:Na+/H+ antiporter NhaA
VTTQSVPLAKRVGQTTWSRLADTPLRAFLRTETGSAAVLLAATIAALVWVNVHEASYLRVWGTEVGAHVGGAGLDLTLREWVNSGLMTFFFFTVGLEARREFDVGELRERSRVMLPLIASIGGMVVPIGIYLAFNAGTGAAHGWGAAMSTDTAFALGVLALVGPRFPDRIRVFLLTLSVVDDLVSLGVIGVAYTAHVSVVALFMAVLFFGVMTALVIANVRGGVPYLIVGTATWIAMLKSGVDPVVVGLAAGLLTYAYPAARGDLERASDLFRLFREQPTPELARTARSGLAAAVSPNERLQQIYHPWVSYLIVPLFAVANAGIPISGRFLAHAYTSPVVLGIIVGYVVGKPVGVAGVSWLVTTLTRGRLRPAVGWAAVTGGGAVAGIGFTVSLLIASLAFSGEQLAEAKLAVLTSALLATLVSIGVFRLTAKLPTTARIRALLGTQETLVDLVAPFDPDRDHLRGPVDAPVTVVEYGDFECPYCGQAEPFVRELLAKHGKSVRYVWRHLPLNDVHPHAEMAAEASEAANAQGAFWPMHDMLMDHQGALTVKDLVGYAKELDLDVEAFRRNLRDRTGAGRVAEDIESADLSGVTGTPTFFINGRRHHGAYDTETLAAAVKEAQARVVISG